MHMLLPGGCVEEEMFVYAGQADQPPGSNEEASVSVEIGGEEFPFKLRRFKVDGQGKPVTDSKRLSAEHAHRHRA